MDTEARTRTRTGGARSPSTARMTSGTEEVIEASGELSEPEFRHIGQLLGEPLGRFKAGSTHFVFGPMTTKTARAVCAYLRSQAVTHDRETTRRWPPPARIRQSGSRGIRPA